MRDGTVLYSKVPFIIDRSEPNFHRSHSKGVNCDVHNFQGIPLMAVEVQTRGHVTVEI